MVSLILSRKFHLWVCFSLVFVLNNFVHPFFFKKVSKLFFVNYYHLIIFMHFINVILFYVIYKLWGIWYLVVNEVVKGLLIPPHTRALHNISSIFELVPFKWKLLATSLKVHGTYIFVWWKLLYKYKEVLSFRSNPFQMSL